MPIKEVNIAQKYLTYKITPFPVQYFPAKLHSVFFSFTLTAQGIVVICLVQLHIPNRASQLSVSYEAPQGKLCSAANWPIVMSSTSVFIDL